MADSPIQRVLGLLLTIFSLSMLPPIAFSLYFRDGTAGEFLESFLVVAIVGLLLWFPARRSQRELRLRDGFLVEHTVHHDGGGGAVDAILRPGDRGR